MLSSQLLDDEIVVLGKTLLTSLVVIDRPFAILEMMNNKNGEYKSSGFWKCARHHYIMLGLSKRLYRGMFCEMMKKIRIRNNGKTAGGARRAR